MLLVDHIQAHRRAMFKLEEAQLAKLAQDRMSWQEAMQDALECESFAAAQAPRGDTQSELHRSAAALALILGELEQAETLVIAAIRDASGWVRPRAESLYRQIRWAKRRKALRVFFRFAV
jgi:hypothetical protein